MRIMSGGLIGRLRNEMLLAQPRGNAGDRDWRSQPFEMFVL
jgi:hypothetical protein